MKNVLITLMAASAFVTLSLPAGAQETRAEVKAEVRAAGIDGSRSAELPTPTGKVVGGASRSAVKAARGSVDGAETADVPTPGGKIVNGKTRAEVRGNARQVVLTSGTAEVPTPGPVRPSLFRKKKVSQ